MSMTSDTAHRLAAGSNGLIEAIGRLSTPPRRFISLRLTLLGIWFLALIGDSYTFIDAFGNDWKVKALSERGFRIEVTTYPHSSFPKFYQVSW